MRLSCLPRHSRWAHLGLALLVGLAGCAGDRSRDGDLAARLRVASVAEASGQPDVALSVLRTLSVAAPENSDVQARYAKALARAGNTAEAETVAAQALRRHPGNRALLREVGNIKVLTGKPLEAIEVFQAVLRSSPAELAALTGRGIALDLLGQHDQAQASYRAALAIDPQNLPALNNLAMSLILADHPQEAVSMLEPLARRSDAPERVRNNLAVARAAATDPEMVYGVAEPAASPVAAAHADMAAIGPLRLRRSVPANLSGSDAMAGAGPDSESMPESVLPSSPRAASLPPVQASTAKPIPDPIRTDPVGDRTVTVPDAPTNDTSGTLTGDRTAVRG